MSVTLEAYFDESGDENRFLVARYLSTHERWLDFAREWCRILSCIQLPLFHMEPCISGNKPFEGIAVTLRDQLIHKLFPLIPENTEWGLSEGVDLGVFKEVVLDNVPEKSQTKDLRDPYFMCFQAALERMVLRAERHVAGLGPEDQIVCFFERQDEFCHRALEYFNRLKADEKNRPWARRLRAPTFETREKYVPLQAADALAWLSNRFMANNLTHPRFDVEDYLRILWNKQNLEHGLLERSGLEDQIERFRAEGHF